MKSCEQKLLSVIVPIYNVESFLPRCLESIINQTYKNLEIICVDDGSTDHSGETADRYAEIDNRIKVIHKENGGLVSARKTGISMANGEYATYVDSDDFIENVMYEEMMGFAGESSADVITSGVIRDYGSESVFISEKIEKGLYIKGSLKNNLLRNMIDTETFFRAGISYVIWNKIVKTNLLQSVQERVDNRVIVGEDIAVVYPLLFTCNSVYVSGKSYYHYCIRETGSILGTKTKDDLERLEILYEYLEQEFSKADAPNMNLRSQFFIIKTYGLLLRNVSRILKYDQGVLYPFGKVSKRDRIVLYGAGKFGMEMKQYLQEQGFHVVAWVDKSVVRPGVLRQETLKEIKYDVVIVAVLIADIVEQIRMDFEKLGISKEKIRYIDAKLIISHNVQKET